MYSEFRTNRWRKFHVHAGPRPRDADAAVRSGGGSLAATVPNPASVNGTAYRTRFPPNTPRRRLATTTSRIIDPSVQATSAPTNREGNRMAS